MSQAIDEMRTAQEVIRDVRVNQAPNGICYATTGEIALPVTEVENMAAAVPHLIAAAMDRKAFYFVPLAVTDGDRTLISDHNDKALNERATCHRNIDSGESQCVFISTGLLDERFYIAFEFYINVGHLFVEKAGVSADFADLVWCQAVAGVRGETSFDAFELRKQALGDDDGRVDEKARSNYTAAAFADAIAIYLLSLHLDFDYEQLRESEYRLLTPSALSERLKKIAQLFPADPGFQFKILYKRRY